jgi:hypothetical protein
MINVSGRAPPFDRRPDLAAHFLDVDDGFAEEMPALLRADLIFKLNHVGTRALERASGVPHVNGVAEPGVGIDDQWQVNDIADCRRVLHKFGQGDECKVGQAEQRVGQAGAGQVDGFKAKIGNNARRESIGGARHYHGRFFCEPGSETRHHAPTDFYWVTATPNPFSRRIG